jgi:outer membrane immunogenic protein
MGMRRFLLAGAFLAAAAAPTLAADLARPVYRAPVMVAVPFSWTGFYVGANAGYAWGNSDVTSVFACPSGICPFMKAINLAAFTAGGTGSVSGNGFTGGVQGGYNWQAGNIVAGAEADFNAFHVNSSLTRTGLPVPAPNVPPASFSVANTLDSKWLLTVRGRLGWTVVPSVLVYATGGLAVSRLEAANFFADTQPAVTSGASSASTTKTGWTVGGGVEASIYHNWTAKIEYLYVDLGSVSTTASATAPGLAGADVYSTSVDLRANIVRAGLNYKFF